MDQKILSECCKTDDAYRRGSRAILMCSVEGCAKDARPGGADGEMCAMHYHRKYRTNSTVQAPKKFAPRVCSSGYISFGSTRAHLHIFKLQHPEKVPDCWSCGMELSWGMGKKMHIDHIDRDKSNNDPSNLRASCWQCNVMRDAWKLD